VQPPLPSRAGGKGCPRVRDRFRLSRLRTPSVSWLGGTSPRGLPAPRFRTVAHAEFLPPYSRAAATVLHRLPGTESAVDVAERCAFRLGRGIALLRVNDLAERPKWRAPRNKTQSCISLSLCERSGSVHVAPTFRWALYNRADAHLKVGATQISPIRLNRLHSTIRCCNVT
jgi:hypothetical protein